MALSLPSFAMISLFIEVTIHDYFLFDLEITPLLAHLFDYAVVLIYDDPCERIKKMSLDDPMACDLL